jgi:5'-nucleotidase
MRKSHTFRKLQPVLVDMDGVTADLVTGLYNRLTRELVAHQYEMLPPKDQLPHFYVDDCVNDPNVKLIINQVIRINGFFRHLPPMPGAIEGVKYLQRACADVGRDMFFCTKPLTDNKTCASDKLDWIEHYFGKDMRKQVILTDDKTLIAGRVLIDDHPRAADGSLTPGWDHCVFSWHYNREMNTGYRLNTWSTTEIDNLLSSL